MLRVLVQRFGATLYSHSSALYFSMRFPLNHITSQRYIWLTYLTSIDVRHFLITFYCALLPLAELRDGNMSLVRPAPKRMVANAYICDDARRRRSAHNVARYWTIGHASTLPAHSLSVFHTDSAHVVQTNEGGYEDTAWRRAVDRNTAPSRGSTSRPHTHARIYNPPNGGRRYERSHRRSRQRSSEVDARTTCQMCFTRSGAPLRALPLQFLTYPLAWILGAANCSICAW